jgi:hypothetical protein
MPKEVQFRRGTTQEHSVFTGADGELTIDTDKNIAVVHDGNTVGGFDLVGVAATQEIYNKTAVGIGTTVPRYNLHVEGTAYISGVSTFTNDVDIKNGYNLYFGNNREGSIKFDGTDFIITENGSGGLSLRGSNVLFQNIAGNKRYLEGIDGQQVSLYFNDVKRLDTTGVGATVFGDFGTSVDLHVNRNSRTIGIATVGILTVSQDANVSRDLVVARDAQVSGMLTVGSNTVSGTVTAGQVFTSPGTWDKPDNLKMIKVTVVGGGGGGGGVRRQAPPTPVIASGGGGGGGTSIRWIPAPTIPGPVSVTVGTGGNGGPAPGTNNTFTTGSTGNTSSFGAFASATGGVGGGPDYNGGSGGSGSSGDMNLSGGGGSGGSSNQTSGSGGSSSLGGGGKARTASGAGEGGGDYGGAGAGAASVTAAGQAGGAGAQGVVIVEEFY